MFSNIYDCTNYICDFMRLALLYSWRGQQRCTCWNAGFHGTWLSSTVHLKNYFPLQLDFFVFHINIKMLFKFDLKIFYGSVHECVWWIQWSQSNEFSYFSAQRCRCFYFLIFIILNKTQQCPSETFLPPISEQIQKYTLNSCSLMSQIENGSNLSLHCGRSNWVHCIVGYIIPLLCTVVCLLFKYLLYLMYYMIFVPRKA